MLNKIKAECEKKKVSGVFKVSELGEEILGEKFVDAVKLALGEDFVLKEDLSRRKGEIEKYLAAQEGLEVISLKKLKDALGGSDLVVLDQPKKEEVKEVQVPKTDLELFVIFMQKKGYTIQELVGAERMKKPEISIVDLTACIESLKSDNSYDVKKVIELLSQKKAKFIKLKDLDKRLGASTEEGVIARLARTDGRVRTFLE